MPWKKILLIILAVIVLGMAGCAMAMSSLIGFGVSKIAQNPEMFDSMIEAGGEVDVQRNADGTVTYSDKTGQNSVTISGDGMVAAEDPFTSEKEVPLPAGFPKDFPVLSGMTSHGGGKMMMEGVTAYSVVWSTDASLESVMTAYEDELGRNGWKQESSMITSEGGMQMYTKPGTLAGTTSTIAMQFANGRTTGDRRVALYYVVDAKAGFPSPMDFGGDGIEE